MSLRWTQAELDAYLAKSGATEKKRSKYNNKKTNGYDSKKEAKRAQMLNYMEHDGQISNLEEQPVYELIPKQDGERAVKYIADFRYIKDGELVVEDVKSAITKKRPDYVLKRKLMLFIHGIKVLET